MYVSFSAKNASSFITNDKHVFTRHQTKAVSPQANNNKQDKVIISSLALKSFGKKTNNMMLKRLMEQKQALMEKRHQLNEDDISPEILKEKIEAINEQIRSLENEMQKIQLEEQRKALGVDEESNKEKQQQQIKNEDNSPNENKTSKTDFFVSQTMNAIVSANSEMAKIDGVKKAQHTLRSEAKSSGGQSKDLDNADELNAKIMEICSDANKKLSENIKTLEKTNDELPENNPTEANDSTEKMAGDQKHQSRQKQYLYKDILKDNVVSVGTKVHFSA